MTGAFLKGIEETMALLFVRYGGLSSVSQKGYRSTMPTFHGPPARRGIYAFVAQAVSHFLLGQETFDSRRAVWVRDARGGRIAAGSEQGQQLREAHPDRYLTRADKDGQNYLARNKKPKRFHYRGEIWHHLPAQRNEILRESGRWVLTTAEAHEIAFRKSFNKFLHAVDHGHPALLLDEFEVFIEKV